MGTMLKNALSRPGFRHFRRAVLFLALTSLLLLRLDAAFLRNIGQTLTQPDGRIVHAFATGDEYYHRLHDKDDYTIVQDPATGYFVYAEKGPGGGLFPSIFIAGRSDPRALGLETGLMAPLAERLAGQDLLSPDALPEGPREAPLSGSLNNIVIFIRFSGETEFTDNLSTYAGMFNASTAGANSMRNYFLEASYNSLSTTATFYPTPGATVVSYLDAQPRGYYQPYNAVSNPIGYTGGDNGTDRTNREHTLLKNAVNAVSFQVPAGLVVDGDGDGYVDNVCFVVRGEPTGWASLLWPHQWSLYTQAAYINSKRVYTYNFQLQTSLLSSGVGVLCHELCHSLGLPDLYHYSQDGRHPVYTWDIMEYDQNPPQHMGAYMKYRYGAWIASIPEITASGTYALNPLTSPTGNCYKIRSPNSGTEYFVVEYRRRTGTFESSLGGQGLLVYRINTSRNGLGNSNGPPDEVYIYRPNGTKSSDGFPSAAQFSSEVARTSINDATNPSSFLTNGAAGGLKISNIGSAGATISFFVDMSAPSIGLDRTSLFFGSGGAGMTTRSQTIIISNSGTGTLNWSVASPQSWISVSPSSGTGTAKIAVSVNPSGLDKGTHTGAVNITAGGATNSPRSVAVTLKIYAASGTSVPFGAFDTPISGATVRGSIPVTGWALDDIEVTKVEVRRGSVAGDPPGAIGADGLVWVGDTTFVEGVRPDVETAQPGYPLNYRAGWGYMLLTYGLPDHGTGTFVLHAVALDKDGHRSDLGTKTIVSDNAHNTKPFGAIDTPGQGATVSGNSYVNFGWVLTPPPAMVPVDGSTIWLWIDSVQVGHPTYNNYRSDIHDAYPDYLNADGAVGFYYINTTAYANGMHTIGWSATDDHGQEEGMGSRFFWVFNGSSGAGAATMGGPVISGLTNAQDNTAKADARNGGLTSGVTSGISPSTCLGSLTDLTGMAADGLSPVYIRRGFRNAGIYEVANPDARGVRNLEIEEVERVVMALDSPEDLPSEGRDVLGKHASARDSAELTEDVRWSGYLVVGNELRPLPIGSTLDPRRGVFYWQPGPGFIGAYRFVFVDGRDGTKKFVTLSVRPKSFPQGDKRAWGAGPRIKMKGRPS